MFNERENTSCEWQVLAVRGCFLFLTLLALVFSSVRWEIIKVSTSWVWDWGRVPREETNMKGSLFPQGSFSDIFGEGDCGSLDSGDIHWVVLGQSCFTDGKLRPVSQKP